MSSVAAAAASASASSPSFYSAAVCRSAELLSCARTVVKIVQSQQLQQQQQSTRNHHHINNLSPADLHLYDVKNDDNNTIQLSASRAMLEDGLHLLRTMESELQRLEALVRRRGHSNDPTDEISASTRRLEADTRALSLLLQQMQTSYSINSIWGKQPRHHWKILQEWFTTVAKRQGERLQNILKIRARVLAEQAQRRKQFQVSATGDKSSSSKTNAFSLQLSSPLKSASATTSHNPLFQMPPIIVPKPPPPPPPPMHKGNHQSNGGSANAAAVNANGSLNGSSHHRPANNTTASSSVPYIAANNSAPLLQKTTAATTTTTATPGYPYSATGPPGFASSSSFVGSRGGGRGGYGGYGGGIGGGGGYGGGAVGMRQRRTAGTGPVGGIQQDDQQQAHLQEQERLLVRQQERQTQQRLREAQEAESALASLGTLFGKMSSLISQQAEVIDNIEDDVEAAHGDVKAGQEEITILYSIKKGNRALILKVFGLIIFLIIFLKFYG